VPERLASSFVHTLKEGAEFAAIQCVVASGHGRENLREAGNRLIQCRQTGEGLAQDPARGRHTASQDLTLAFGGLKLLRDPQQAWERFDQGGERDALDKVATAKATATSVRGNVASQEAKPLEARLLIAERPRCHSKACRHLDLLHEAYRVPLLIPPVAGPRRVNHYQQRSQARARQAQSRAARCDDSFHIAPLKAPGQGGVDFLGFSLKLDG
jgi:hypothetical protein